MIIRNVMTRNPYIISPESSVTEAKALMSKKNISKLPVVDKANRLVGIITKNDLAKAGPSDATTLDMFEIGYLLSKLTVSKVMVKDVVTVSENEVVEEAARIMVDRQIGCIPVVENDVLVGIVTESDLFHLFTDMFCAGQKGVRAALVLDDKPGQFLHITEEIARLNGNIVSLVTQELEDKTKRLITVKATGITLEQFREILSKIQLTADDIRVV
ncbi:MAG: CBS and ACT domain-containing protein [Treponema porcinum]|uniref:CBS and ACT domain-containing protein n=1 Tax=Treponema porcinum TaxID=261392 RepID=UPI0023532C70|nr:CBS and ACT domain-containing protein [Treponema porcinum]MCI7533704.1 CBS and ACT domain-containing protein [Treponema porcinum]